MGGAVFIPFASRVLRCQNAGRDSKIALPPYVPCEWDSLPNSKIALSDPDLSTKQGDGDGYCETTPSGTAWTRLLRATPGHSSLGQPPDTGEKTVCSNNTVAVNVGALETPLD